MPPLATFGQTWKDEPLGLARVDLRSYRFQTLLGAAGLDVAGIFTTQLTLLATTRTAEAVHAG